MNKQTYHREYNKARYYRVKAWMFSIVGDTCIRCNATATQIDHKDPTKKSFEISNNWSNAKHKLEAELQKCQPLCKPCHIDKTRKDLGQNDARKVHGTLSSYRYCKCDLCRQAKNKWEREYKQRRKLAGVTQR